jgi:hypothetical protein
MRSEMLALAWDRELPGDRWPAALEKFCDTEQARSAVQAVCLPIPGLMVAFSDYWVLIPVFCGEGVWTCIPRTSCRRQGGGLVKSLGREAASMHENLKPWTGGLTNDGRDKTRCKQATGTTFQLNKR